MIINLGRRVIRFVWGVAGDLWGRDPWASRPTVVTLVREGEAGWVMSYDVGRRAGWLSTKIAPVQAAVREAQAAASERLERHGQRPQIRWTMQDDPHHFTGVIVRWQ